MLDLMELAKTVLEIGFDICGVILLGVILHRLTFGLAGGTANAQAGRIPVPQAPVPVADAHTQGVWKRDEAGRIVNESHR